jgi:predicted component of type VI protein secretion system
VLVRKPAVGQRAADIFTEKIKEITEPFFVTRPLSSRAYFNVLTPTGSLPATIEVSRRDTRIGRDPNLSDLVIPDRRVSRYHCRLSEESEGRFRLWDEGSTSGTYVNDEAVSMSGRLLQPGDLINVGPVQLRFQLDRAQVEESFEGTEPWVPRAHAPTAVDDATLPGFAPVTRPNGGAARPAAPVAPPLPDERWDEEEEDEEENTQPFPLYD